MRFSIIYSYPLKQDNKKNTNKNRPEPADVTSLYIRIFSYTNLVANQSNSRKAFPPLIYLDVMWWGEFCCPVSEWASWNHIKPQPAATPWTWWGPLLSWLDKNEDQKKKKSKKKVKCQPTAWTWKLLIAQKDERVMVKHKLWFIINVNIQNNKKTLKSGFFLPGELCMVSLI